MEDLRLQLQQQGEESGSNIQNVSAKDMINEGVMVIDAHKGSVGRPPCQG